MQKALRGLETGIDGFSEQSADREEIVQEIGEAGPERLLYVGDAFRIGHESRRDLRGDGDRPLVPGGRSRRSSLQKKRWPAARLDSLSEAELRFLKQKGFADRRLARLLASDEHAVRGAPAFARRPAGLQARSTPVPPSSRRRRRICIPPTTRNGEADPTDRKKIMVLGGGPNRIGQGIEFDYCCVHAALAMREDGYETIMVNCNPETVSTDYDTSDRLYFEPVTLEDVLEIVAKEKPFGVIVQYGGQTPLKLALELERAGVPIVGTTPDSIDIAEDRERFQKLLHELGLKQPPNRTARTEEAALVLAQEIGYPLVVRPSYVLGGRAMEIVHGDKDLERYMREAVKVSEKSPVLLDPLPRRCDRGRRRLHQRRHRGDDRRHHGARRAGRHPFGRLGLFPAAVFLAGKAAGRVAPADEADGQGARSRRPDERAVRDPGVTSPATAMRQWSTCLKSTRVRRARCRSCRRPPASRWRRSRRAAWSGNRWPTRRTCAARWCRRTSLVKEAVFPFNKFPGVDPILGPEMRSTGEVMGAGRTFGEAMLKKPARRTARACRPRAPFA